MMKVSNVLNRMRLLERPNKKYQHLNVSIYIYLYTCCKHIEMKNQKLFDIMMLRKSEAFLKLINILYIGMIQKYQLENNICYILLQFYMHYTVGITYRVKQYLPDIPNAFPAKV